mgnify:CR=1 FL=1
MEIVLPHDPLSDVPLVHQSHAIYALVDVAETGTVIHPEYAVTVLAELELPDQVELDAIVTLPVFWPPHDA